MADTNDFSLERSFERYGGLSDYIITTLMDKLGLEQTHIDKAKEILDMVEFTVVDGQKLILINIGENMQMRIKK